MWVETQDKRTINLANAISVEVTNYVAVNLAGAPQFFSVCANFTPVKQPGDGPIPPGMVVLAGFDNEVAAKALKKRIVSGLMAGQVFMQI